MKSRQLLFSLFLMIAIGTGLALTAVLWWRLRPWPQIAWETRHPRISAVRISSNGQALATFDDERMILWDVASGHERLHIDDLGSLNRNYPNVWLSPDGHAMLFLTKDIDLKLWHAARHPTPVLLWRIKRKPWSDPPQKFEVFFAPDSLTAITLTNTGPKRWDLAYAHELPVALPQGDWDPRWLHRTAAGPILAVQCTRSTSRPVSEFEVPTNTVSSIVWDLEAETKKLLLDGMVDRVAFSRDGKVAATATWPRGEAVKVWDLTTGRQRCSIPYPEAQDCRYLDLDQEGTRLAMVLADRGDQRENTLWDVSTEAARLIKDFGPGYADFSPDGRWLRRHGPNSANSLVYDSDVRRLRIALEQPGWFIGFSPDGQTVAGWCDRRPVESLSWLRQMLGWKTVEERVIKLWELPAGNEIAELNDRANYDFFPDGKRLVTWRENRIEIWDLPPRRPTWVKFGLPIVFAALLITAGRLVWRLWWIVRFISTVLK